MDTQNLTQHNLYAQAVKTMTSREIAAVVEKRHDNVKRTIETLAAKGIFTLPQIEETSFLDSAGKKQRTTEYRVCKRDSYVIVAQLSPEFTARLVDRWQELEAQQQAPQPAFTLPTNFLEALECLVAAEKDKIALTTQVEEMQPTVAAYDRLASAVNTMNITDAAKQLNMNPGALIKWMTSNKWVYKPQSGKSWMAYQPRLDAGLMTHITHTTERDGQVRTFYRAHVTAKGLATISKQIEKARQTAMILGEAA